VVVEYELTDAVAWIYLNRPHRLNAVVPELAAGLAAAFARAGQDNALVVAADDAQFGFPEVSVGLIRRPRRLRARRQGTAEHIARASVRHGGRHLGRLGWRMSAPFSQPGRDGTG